MADPSNYKVELNLHTSSHRPPASFHLKQIKNPYPIAVPEETTICAQGQEKNVPAGRRARKKMCRRVGGVLRRARKKIDGPTGRCFWRRGRSGIHLFFLDVTESHTVGRRF